MKAYMHTALNSSSRGWFGVVAYVQNNNGTRNWQVISQANLDYVAWILAWVSAHFITQIIICV